MKQKEAIIRVKSPISNDEKSGNPKEIKSIESYHIVHIIYVDDTASLYRESKGMDGFKLLGLLTMIRDEISRQISPSTKDEFTHVKRVARSKEVIQIVEKK